MSEIQGNILDIKAGKWIKGRLFTNGTLIKEIVAERDVPDLYIMPGFIDAHIHIESSMLTPHNFAQKAITHGTIATVSDPHEIANVCGITGIEYMLKSAEHSGLKFFFGAPSCVPATTFETAGAVLDSNDVKKLLERDDIYYLSEMMNYPGVLHNDVEVMNKISHAKKLNKPIDGHAPGLRGADAKKYIESGISTDHECYTKEEALEKIKCGMKILIREGSAARNFEALHELITEFPDMIMLCCDDKHPDELMLGHINKLVAKAVAKGHDPITVIRCASLNAVRHYNLNVGLLQPGDPADFIVVKDLKDFQVQETWVNGKKLASNGISLIPNKKETFINNFSCATKKPEDFIYTNSDNTSNRIRVIGAVDGQLVTSSLIFDMNNSNRTIFADINRDILKIAVVNRYKNVNPAVSFINGIGLKSGAIASTVAHDSHNIVVAGVDDESICRAVNLLIKNKGGLSVVRNEKELVLPLPVAGLMTNKSCDETAELYLKLDQMTKEMGSKLRSPFMTLSFMALLVIPSLKLSDKGLFDGDKFELVS